MTGYECITIVLMYASLLCTWTCLVMIFVKYYGLFD